MNESTQMNDYSASRSCAQFKLCIIDWKWMESSLIHSIWVMFLFSMLSFFWLSRYECANIRSLSGHVFVYRTKFLHEEWDQTQWFFSQSNWMRNQWNWVINTSSYYLDPIYENIFSQVEITLRIALYREKKNETPKLVKRSVNSDRPFSNVRQLKFR